MTEREAGPTGRDGGELSCTPWRVLFDGSRERRLGRHGRWYDRVVELDKNFKDSLTGLVLAALRNDNEDVKDCAAFVAKRLEGYGEKDCAETLRRMLGRGDFVDGAWTPRRWWGDTSYQEKEEQLYGVYGAVQVTKSWNTFNPPSILTPDQRTTVEEILNVARVRLQDSEPRPTCVLTYGTAVEEPVELAHYIARQLRIECFVVQPGKKIDPRVGRWSGQLHRLSESVVEPPCVLVLKDLEDFCNSTYVEDSWRVEELKCVRDRFLKNLSMLEAPTVVVACTNMEMNLDPEDWERFTYRMELNAAEPNVWILLARGVAKDGLKGFRKVYSTLSEKDRQTPWNPTDASG